MKVPRPPRMMRGEYRRPGHEDCLACKAGAKSERHAPQPPARKSGRRQAGEGPPEAWHPGRVKTAPVRKHTAGFTPEGYAPTGKHRSLGTAKDTGYKGRRRAHNGRDDYEGRHRR